MSLAKISISLKHQVFYISVLIVDVNLTRCSNLVCIGPCIIVIVEE